MSTWGESKISAFGFVFSSSGKQSDLVHFWKPQGKVIPPFPCTLFLHIFDRIALFHATKDIIEIIIYANYSQYLDNYLGQRIGNNYLGQLILNHKTPSGETGCLGNPYFTACLSFQFLNSHTCVTYGTPCHARRHQVLFDSPCYLRDAMPRQRSPGKSIPREVEDKHIPRGDKHFKHVPSPTYLTYLPPKDLYR